MTMARPYQSHARLIAGVACTSLAPWTLAQPQITVESPAPEVIVESQPDPDAAARAAQREAILKQRELERRLNKLRATHFGSIRNTQIRQAGIVKLREHTDPSEYPTLVKVFRREQDDVRKALVDLLGEQRNDEADATLTWVAIFERDEAFRALAMERLRTRIHPANDPEGDARYMASDRVKGVIAGAFKRGIEHELNAAATLAAELQLIEAIPALINAQVFQTPTGTSAGIGNTGGVDHANIYIATQQAYVADLTPVVADSAVAFDPQIAVVTEGTVLRVSDAVVTTYRYEIHNALVRLTSRAWGQSTSGLGFDIPGWGKWYRDEFLPTLASKSPGTDPR
jgi:hypothetical protein